MSWINYSNRAVVDLFYSEKRMINQKPSTAYQTKGIQRRQKIYIGPEYLISSHPLENTRKPLMDRVFGWQKSTKKLLKKSLKRVFLKPKQSFQSNFF